MFSCFEKGLCLPRDACFKAVRDDKDSGGSVNISGDLLALGSTWRSFERAQGVYRYFDFKEGLIRQRLDKPELSIFVPLFLVSESKLNVGTWIML